MDYTPMTDEEMKLFLEEQDEVERHRDAGTLYTPNMTSYLAKTFNDDTSPAARALLDVAVMFEWQVRETAAAWAGTGVASELAAHIVSAAEKGADILDADATAFLRAFVAYGAASLGQAGDSEGEIYPHKIIAELQARKPDTQESWDQLRAAACFKSWWGANIQLEELARKYGPRKPKRGALLH